MAVSVVSQRNGGRQGLDKGLGRMSNGGTMEDRHWRHQERENGAGYFNMHTNLQRPAIMGNGSFQNTC